MIENNSPIYKNLLSIGFSEKGASVYLALLELGKRTVSPIARKAGINRTTAYDVLDSLVGKGLVSVSGKEPLQEYVAESPDKILLLAQREIESKQQHLKQAENLVPQLKSLHNISDRAKITFYEGKQGLEQVYEDTLTSHEQIRAYATYDDMEKALPGYFPKYFYRRAKKGIKIRAIFPHTEAGVKLAGQNKEQLRETAIVPIQDFYFTPEINIYDNKTMIASWKEKLGIIIESAEIADAMKKIFELAWAEAKRLEANSSQTSKN
ncbi:MAG: helix-turn-helix domain-containing protein [Patescibacteria group bacterium]